MLLMGYRGKGYIVANAIGGSPHLSNTASPLPGGRVYLELGHRGRTLRSRRISVPEAGRCAAVRVWRPMLLGCPLRSTEAIKEINYREGIWKWPRGIYDAIFYKCVLLQRTCIVSFLLTCLSWNANMSFNKHTPDTKSSIVPLTLRHLQTCCCVVVNFCNIARVLHLTPRHAATN